MSFSLVHFNEHLFLETKSGTKFDVFGRYDPPFNAAIDISYGFSKGSSPSDTTVTIHGLTRRHARLFKPGSTVTVIAGWCNSDCSQNNYHTIFSEKIADNVNMIDSGGDWQLSFTCMDGKSLAKEQSLAKMKSSSVRADASDRSGNNGAERSELRRVTDWAQHQRLLLGRQSKALTKWFRKNSGYLTSQDHTLAQKDKVLTNERKAEIKAVEARIPKKPGDGHHRGDTTKINTGRSHERKIAEDAINKQFDSMKNALKVQKAKIRHMRASNSKRRHRKAIAIKTNRQRVSRTAKRQKSRIRTRNASRREKSRRSRARRKSKSDKHKNGLHFKKNTMAKTIIMSLAKRAHLKIAKIQLVHNKKYTAGYTADKTPIQCIKDVVDDCDSSIWRPHGQLYIGDFANHTPSNFVLSPETGLTSTPQPQDDDSSDSSITTYQVNAIFLPEATVGWTFRLVDPASDLIGENKEPIHRGDFFDDEVIVTDGTLEVDSGSTPTSSLTVVKKKDQAKAETAKIKSKSRKIKAHKDARDRHKTKVHRAKRQHSRRK